MNDKKCEAVDVDKQNFGQLVQKHRKIKEYSQDELGNLIGISRKSISCIERGECYPSPENIFKIAALLDISLDEYLYSYSRFDETISVNEINDMLVSLSQEQRSTIIYTMRAMCKALMRKKR